MTMNPEIKAEWVKRLRSGEYKQGRNFLNKRGNFCCLGVLCEIGLDQGLLEKQPAGTGVDVFAYRAVGGGPKETTVLPRDFATYIGLDLNPEIESGALGGLSLAELNDFERKTFAEIADLIEEHL